MVQFPQSDDVARPSRFVMRCRFIPQGMQACFGLGGMLVNGRLSKGSWTAIHGMEEYQGLG